ncbi:MAG TPA: hypothetical protein VHA80_00565 [Solirubrobacterales bacterium]|nr:hypothetical protein [Solirubrobacterales bacterium]HVY96259.1 hypothetical protein [Solirubrobacterales bacterium]
MHRPSPSRASAGATAQDERAKPVATRISPLDRARAWLVTGALGRGVAFAIDFAAAARTLLRARRP